MLQEVQQVPGLFYIENIFSEEEEEEIIKCLDRQQWIPITKSENSRLVQHYGFKYNYTTGEPGEKTEPLPKFLKKLRKRLKKLCLEEEIIDEDYCFNQCIVNNYYSGQGIANHCDHQKYGHTIGCFTLGSSAEMTFCKKTNHGGPKPRIVKVNLQPKPRSLYIMSGECRKKWSHCMVARKTDPSPGGKRSVRGRRISVTFRQVSP